ncbi:type I polyketide synthase [Kitasatospora indigofera]|uniref:type I polyketide synthase n=1 Tax=Kitasatospora indigofera TaxID=67307 RepID=UPI0033AC8FCF
MSGIAVVGMGCRLPGGVHGPREYWDFLLRKGDGIVEVPADRWDLDLFYDADVDAPGRMYTRRGGFLADSVWEFDADFFGISRREASVMDPQQRLVLEVAWEALDDAGMAGRVPGGDTGVYIGGFMSDNQVRRHMPQGRLGIDAHTSTSGTFTMLSNRLSYVLDLHGPSMTIDTACSSSLVAVHEAVQSLLRGECGTALAGGVNVMLHPETFVSMCKGRFLSRDGRSKVFDASADGYARGEGAGVVVLKPVEAAVRDGDRIYAVLLGTGANQDGRTPGITVPNGRAQAGLARQVCERAGVKPSDIGYLEAHGTGTSIGDPVEMAAMGGALGAVAGRRSPLVVGSVKAAIGHLEAAAGIAGVIKAALTVHHRTMVPQAWLQNLNPAIPFADLGLRVATEIEPFPVDVDAYAAVNGFGYGGTNAHAILGQAPLRAVMPAPPAAGRGAVRLLPVSGTSAGAVAELAGALAKAVTDAGDDLGPVRDAAWVRRAHHPVRTAVAYRDTADLAAKLRALGAGGARRRSARSCPPAPRRFSSSVAWGRSGGVWAAACCRAVGRSPRRRMRSTPSSQRSRAGRLWRSCCATRRSRG